MQRWATFSLFRLEAGPCVVQVVQRCPNSPAASTKVMIVHRPKSAARDPISVRLVSPPHCLYNQVIKACGPDAHISARSGGVAMDLSIWPSNGHPSWQEQLRKQVAAIRAAAQATAAAPRVPDPWEALLVDLKGGMRDGGFERVATCITFEHLGLTRSERTSGAARRLARAMRQLGWLTTRFQLSPGSYQRV